MYDPFSQLPYLWDLEGHRGGERFKVIIWVGNASVIVGLTGYCKRFCKMPFFYITAVLLVFYLLRLARPKVQLRLNYNLCNVIFL